jgi:hypothetical protein
MASAKVTGPVGTAAARLKSNFVRSAKARYITNRESAALGMYTAQGHHPLLPSTGDIQEGQSGEVVAVQVCCTAGRP